MIRYTLGVIMVTIAVLAVVGLALNGGGLSVAAGIGLPLLIGIVGTALAVTGARAGQKQTSPAEPQEVKATDEPPAETSEDEFSFPVLMQVIVGLAIGSVLILAAMILF